MRPIFALSLAIVIVIAGFISLRGLPVEQYPEALQKHAAWAQEILARHPELNSDSVHLILQDEVGQVFAQVLADAGVYKLDEPGRAGFVRFLESVK